MELDTSWQQQVQSASGTTLVSEQARDKAATFFLENGFPSTKIEEWKYTNVAPIARARFALEVGTASEEASALLANVAAPHDAIGRVVIVNGQVDWSLSQVEELPKGLRVYALRERAKIANAEDKKRIDARLGSITPSDEAPFVALHTACATDGVAILIDEGQEIERPLCIVTITTTSKTEGSATASYPKLFVDAAARSSCCILESCVGTESAQYFSNLHAEFFVAEAVHLTHYRMQQESAQAFHVSSIDATIEANSHFETNCFSFGGALVRNTVRVHLAGENSHAAMNGLSVLHASQHVDNTTILDHAVPNCTSHELYKGIYGEKSEGVFSGTIIVREDAQKTNAFQSNQALLLSRDATINSRPQLKIWADDVKCSHGATVGQLDDDQLFYLMARGIPKSKARDILIHGFAEGLIDQVQTASVRELLETALIEKLRVIPSEI